MKKPITFKEHIQNMTIEQLTDFLFNIMIKGMIQADPTSVEKLNATVIKLEKMEIAKFLTSYADSDNINNWILH